MYMRYQIEKLSRNTADYVRALPHLSLSFSVFSISLKTTLYEEWSVNAFEL